MNFLWVFLGGGLGSVLRYALSLLLSRVGDRLFFPWHTLLANALGCLLLGAFMAYAVRSSSSSLLFWTTGFCGGFTTFSTFSWEWVQMLRQGCWSMAFVYFFLSILLCMGLLWVGFRWQNVTLEL